MPRASTKVFKKRRGVFNKGRCKKINDGCVEGISTVPKNCAEEKNFADGAKPCTNETEPSASERKILNMEFFFRRTLGDYWSFMREEQVQNTKHGSNLMFAEEHNISWLVEVFGKTDHSGCTYNCCK
ncbi:hypothetical protein TNIN_447901 [Trichonephila inaurata madagascariensis]|uniref:Uncharacterized protein n=1 Tax=Trichonephila inaurata madagascariensis TaxID=2747483 RepID=A0A8X6YHV6_9ARAC|nr:hypothetical protein TNIN_447901 [Trichonephila inaurata madagascariensis]